MGSYLLRDSRRQVILLTVASGYPLGLRTSGLILGIPASRGVEGLQQLNDDGQALEVPAPVHVALSLDKSADTQRECLSSGSEWFSGLGSGIKTVASWHSYTMEYYAAVKKKISYSLRQRGGTWSISC